MSWYSTWNLGSALLRNNGKLLLVHITKHFYISTLSERRPHSIIPDQHCSYFVVEKKVQDARKDTDTHHLGNHSRTNAQGYLDFADCDPLVSVNSFENDSTSTSTVDLEACDTIDSG